MTSGTLTISSSGSPTAIVVAADLIAHRLGYGHPAGFPDTSEALVKAMGRIGIAPTEIDPIVERIKEAFDQQSSVFN